MNNFRHGFASELLKLAAFAPQHADDGAYDGASGITQTLKNTQGSNAKAGLKSGAPVTTPVVGKKRAPTPLTTPSNMMNYPGGA